MKRIMLIVVVIALGASACSGSDDSAADCEELADTSIATIQGVIDDLDSLTLAEQAALGSDDAPALLGDIERRFDDLASQADALACSAEEMSLLVQERLSQLSSESDFGELVLDQLQSSIDEGGFLGSGG